MLTLGVDTSGPWCAVALLQGSQVLAHVTAPMKKGQAEHLMPLMQSVLTEQGLDFGDLDRIGVCTGPGNFTGVRIAVSAVRGLSMAAGVPAVGVSTFEIMRGPASAKDMEPAMVSVPAPRDALYLQGFAGGQASGPAQMVRLWQDAISPLQSATCVIGAEAHDVAYALNGAKAGPWRAHPAEIVDPSLTVAHIAQTKPVADQPARPKPFYVRAADAAPSSDTPPHILP